MNTERGSAKVRVVPCGMIQFLWVLMFLAALFGFLIFFIPHEDYRLIGNTCEVAAALFCMFSCLYPYRTWSDPVILLLAAFAFGGYALATIFWYPDSLRSGLHRTRYRQITGRGITRFCNNRVD